jgi:leucyl-tRNA synthetase
VTNVDEKVLSAVEINLPIQINGKLISTIKIPQNLSQDEVLKEAQKNEKISKALENTEIKKIIFVPNKIISIIL